MSEKSLLEVDLARLCDRQFFPSPAAWEDQVLYFLMLDRFSDGNEQGYRGNNTVSSEVAGVVGVAPVADLTEWACRPTMAKLFGARPAFVAMPAGFPDSTCLVAKT